MPVPVGCFYTRQQQLEQWLARQLSVAVSGVSAGSDAGFRRYFRYQLEGRSLIAMDAPPGKEDCRPFVKVAAMLAEAGVLVSAPKTYGVRLSYDF